jgi:hypothetical protein
MKKSLICLLVLVAQLTDANIRPDECPSDGKEMSRKWLEHTERATKDHQTFSFHGERIESSFQGKKSLSSDIFKKEEVKTCRKQPYRYIVNKCVELPVLDVLGIGNDLFYKIFMSRPTRVYTTLKRAQDFSNSMHFGGQTTDAEKDEIAYALMKFYMEDYRVKPKPIELEVNTGALGGGPGQITVIGSGGQQAQEKPQPVLKVQTAETDDAGATAASLRSGDSANTGIIGNRPGGLKPKPGPERRPVKKQHRILVKDWKGFVAFLDEALEQQIIDQYAYDGLMGHHNKEKNQKLLGLYKDPKVIFTEAPGNDLFKLLTDANASIFKRAEVIKSQIAGINGIQRGGAKRLTDEDIFELAKFLVDHMPEEYRLQGNYRQNDEWKKIEVAFRRAMDAELIDHYRFDLITRKYEFENRKKFGLDLSAKKCYDEVINKTHLKVFTKVTEHKTGNKKKTINVDFKNITLLQDEQMTLGVSFHALNGYKVGNPQSQWQNFKANAASETGEEVNAVIEGADRILRPYNNAMEISIADKPGKKIEVRLNDPLYNRLFKGSITKVQLKVYRNKGKKLKHTIDLEMDSESHMRTIAFPPDDQKKPRAYIQMRIKREGTTYFEEKWTDFKQSNKVKLK